MGDLFNLNNILMKKLAIIVETLTKLLVLKLMNVDVLLKKFSSRLVFRIQINFNKYFLSVLRVRRIDHKHCRFINRAHATKRLAGNQSSHHTLEGDLKI